MKGGLGSASLRGKDDVVVAALAVVNAFGDVVDPSTGHMIAGLRNCPEGRTMIPSSQEIRKGVSREIKPLENTTLVVVAANARLDKPRCTKLAQMAQVGVARAISPAHSLHDGDVAFALSVGDAEADLHHLGILAEQATVLSIIRAVRRADGLGGVIAWKDLVGSP
jgi:L-aminopeptidase/D-esterase-like protein